MDPGYSLQDVVRCDVCDTPVPPLHCDFCQTNLCKTCVGDHLLDDSKRHQVVSFYKKETLQLLQGRNEQNELPLRHHESSFNYPSCINHLKEKCMLYCKDCDQSICTKCTNSKKHKKHNFVSNLDYIENKRLIQRDLHELEEAIYPKYQKILSSFPIRIANIHKKYVKLSTALIKQGEVWHKEINMIIEKIKADIDKMESRCKTLLKRQEEEITCTTSEITQIIANLKESNESNDFSLISAYQSRNAIFRKLPNTLRFSLPTFYPEKFDTESLYKQFGYLSALTISTEEHGYTMDDQEVKPLLADPCIITTIQTGDKDVYEKLHSVACKSDDEVWVCGSNNILTLYNIQGEFLKSIHTLSGNIPCDISVTQSGDLVYSDYSDRTLNIVIDDNINEIMRIQNWMPLDVSSTSSGDLLVVLVSDDFKQTKVVCYSGSTEKQSIQFNDEGQPLYTTGDTKYISENKNLDICVSDFGARAVVVVNQIGKLRFIYTGPPSVTDESFYPHGITTDSQCRILTVDYESQRIHILDQDGQFLRYIDNCDLQEPWGVCIDTRDNLLVAEWKTGIVKKIKYCL